MEMEKNGLGCQVTCRIGDEKAPLMTLKLSVADDLQAKLIREHFSTSPSCYTAAFWPFSPGTRACGGPIPRSSSI